MVACFVGDIGYFDSKGCCFVVDRVKELIKYNAYQVGYIKCLNCPEISKITLISYVFICKILSYVFYYSFFFLQFIVQTCDQYYQ